MIEWIKPCNELHYNILFIIMNSFWWVGSKQPVGWQWTKCLINRNEFGWVKKNEEILISNENVMVSEAEHNWWWRQSVKDDENKWNPTKEAQVKHHHQYYSMLNEPLRSETKRRNIEWMNKWTQFWFYHFIQTTKAISKCSYYYNCIEKGERKKNIYVYQAFRKLEPPHTSQYNNNNQHARLQFYLHIFRFVV